MSHIVGFRIDGLAGRDQVLSFELNRDINVFFGLNGCGKTSLLKILHSAMSNDSSLIQKVPFRAAQVDIYSIRYDATITMRIENPKIVQKSSSEELRGTMSESAEMEDFVDGVISDEKKLTWERSSSVPEAAKTTKGWLHKYLPTTRLLVGKEPYFAIPRHLSLSDSDMTEEQLDAYFARSVVSLWNDYSNQILGLVRTAQGKGLASILSAVLSTKESQSHSHKSKLTAEVAYDRLKNFLRRQGSLPILGSFDAFARKYKSDETLQDIVQDIDNVEIEIERAMATRNTLQDLITKMISGNKSIRFTDQSIKVETRDGDEIGLTSLSTGEKHLLRILVPTLLIGKNTLLIDEPEISLHVDWQRDLIHSMRALNPEAQLIFATHSPEVMAHVDDKNIFSM